MKLFNCQSGKGRLQQGLDKDQAGQGGTVVEETPSAGCCCDPKQDCKRLFKGPKEATTIFKVDLLGGWVKP